MGLAACLLLASLASIAAYVPPSIRLISLTPSTASAALDAPAAPVVLSGRQPLTLSFSHAVIALGSDFGAGAPGRQSLRMTKI